MIRERILSVSSIALVWCLISADGVWGQTAAQQPQATGAATQPTASTGQAQAAPSMTSELSAEVVEVKGLVERSAVEADEANPAGSPWVPVEAGEKLGGGTKVRTGLRAHLILRFGETSVVMIRRSTLASISQFYREANTETIRLGLGYGAVRGGTTEGTIRSDFVVESTVATLAKRGTEGWEFRVEPYTGRWRVALAESGLLEAIEKATSRRRLVRPGEYADQANIGSMWIKQDIFNRTVQFYQANTITEADLDWNLRNPTGYGVLGPGQGTEARTVAGRPSTSPVPAVTPGRLSDQAGVLGVAALAALTPRSTIVARPEGNFGFGRTFGVLLPVSGR